MDKKEYDELFKGTKNYVPYEVVETLLNYAGDIAQEEVPYEKFKKALFVALQIQNDIKKQINN